MNNAQYLNSEVGKGGNGLYPLSIQGLDFIQEQIKFLQQITGIGGKRYILVQPTKDTDGVVVIDGEILPLKASSKPGNGIKIEEQKVDIIADGVTYKAARVRRYAMYVPNYAEDTPGLYPTSGFADLQTNDQLAKKFQDYGALATEIAKRLLVTSTKTLTRTQLDGLKDNVRINCRQGCVPLNGAIEYTIDVYHHSDDHITQVQTLPDGTRFIRKWIQSKKAWSGFSIDTDNFHIEIKVKGGTTVYVRHSYIPEGMRLVLLRKKTRSRKRRSGGVKTTNNIYKGKTVYRQPKRQYVHYRGIILSTGTPGKWYVPKCIAIDGDTSNNKYIGKELGTICEGLIYELGNTGVYSVASTRKRLSAKAKKDGTAATGFSEIALQFAEATETFKTPGGEMARMKYRLWFEQKTKDGKISYIARRGFSVV